MFVILPLWRLSQEDQDFKASMGYIARPYLKQKQKETTQIANSDGVIAELWVVLMMQLNTFEDYYAFNGKSLQTWIPNYILRVIPLCKVYQFIEA